MTLLSALSDALIWYLALSLLAILAYPLVFHACAWLPDRGLSLARPLGLLIMVLPLWIIGNLAGVPFTAVSVFLVAVTVGAAAWAIDLRSPSIVEFVRERWPRWALIESSTLALFLGYALARGFNPDARATEKPMELAFLSASINSTSIPVHDPWFAGEIINYYYLGYVALGGIAKLSSTPPGVAFTLGLATVFALATVAAGGTAANFTESFLSRTRLPVLASAILSAYMLSFAGNLHAAGRLLSDPRSTITDSWWAGIGWRSSRVVEDGGFSDDGVRTVITEFPAFAFVLGDLHPHVIAYPWLISAIALCLCLAVALRYGRHWQDILAPTALVGMVAGGLYAANSWDVPLVGALLLAALIGGRWLESRRKILITGATFAFSALVTALPFAFRYTPATGDSGTQPAGVLSAIPLAEVLARNLGVVTWDRTSFQELATVHGAFYVCVVVIILVSWFGILSRERPPALHLFVAVVALLVSGWLLHVPAIAAFGAPIVMLVYLARRAQRDPARRLALTLTAVALMLVVAVEFFFIRDAFGDRMNTVFKMYFQVWAVLSIAVPPLIAGAYSRVRRSLRQSAQLATGTAVTVAIIATAAYMPISLYHWNDGFRGWDGLDAAGYIYREHPDEAAIIAWVEQNVEPDAPILEAPGCSYGSDRGIPHNRVSMATGRPTVIGWTGHQFQWRRAQDTFVEQISARVAIVNSFYDEVDQPADAVRDDYDIQLVIVGNLERFGYAHCDLGPPYSEAGLDRLEHLGWKTVFERAGSRIYERPSD
jgi:YYY domain-containing protein